MVQQAGVAPVQEVSEGSLVCRHHWLIQAADGPHQQRSLPHLRRSARVQELRGDRHLGRHPSDARPGPGEPAGRTVV